MDRGRLPVTLRVVPTGPEPLLARHLDRVNGLVEGVCCLEAWTTLSVLLFGPDEAARHQLEDLRRHGAMPLAVGEAADGSRFFLVEHARLKATLGAMRETALLDLVRRRRADTVHLFVVDGVGWSIHPFELEDDVPPDDDGGGGEFMPPPMEFVA